MCIYPGVLNSLDSIAHPGKGGAFIHNKKGCSSVLLTGKQQPMTKGMWGLWSLRIYDCTSQTLVGLSEVSRQTQRIWARRVCEKRKQPTKEQQQQQEQNQPKLYEKHIVRALGSLPFVKDMLECFQLQLKRQLSSQVIQKIWMCARVRSPALTACKGSHRN